MTIREKKGRLCTKHKTLLELIFYLGKGVMFKQHILLYMNALEGINEIDMSKIIGELKANEILDSYSLCGAKIIKLKKYAVYFLLGKEREEVSSILFTIGKAKKSAFLNEIILQKPQTLKSIHSSVRGLIDYYLTETTYFSKDKEAYIYLENQIKRGWCTPFAKEEVSSLISSNQKGHKFKKMDKENEIKKNFNLNSMQSSNIYLGPKKTSVEDGKRFLFVEIPDVGGYMTIPKISKKIIDTQLYLDELFNTNKVNFSYTVYVQSQERKDYIFNKRNKIEDTVNKECKIVPRFYVVNLDLEKRLFKNQKVLL